MISQDVLYCCENDAKVIHKGETVEEVKRLAVMSQEEINEWCAKYDSVFASPVSCPDRMKNELKKVCMPGFLGDCNVGHRVRTINE